MRELELTVESVPTPLYGVSLLSLLKRSVWDDLRLQVLQEGVGIGISDNLIFSNHRSGWLAVSSSVSPRTCMTSNIRILARSNI